MQFLLVSGLWLGSVKPDMNMILKPILSKIKTLENSGKIIKTKVGKKKLRAKLILATFDLIAKAMAMKFTQFNGKYGCPFCLDKGTYEMKRTIYPPNDSHEPRLFSDVIAWAELAKELEEPVYGVLGISILSEIIDIILCIPVDYMQAILEGLAKQFMKFWFGSEFSAYVFNIRTFLNEIDKRLLRMKPPHAFRRCPRSIKCLSFWKAAEFRAWLLYYSIPALKDYLPQIYLNHWCLLVCAMHILLNKSISSDDLEMASDYLAKFYEQASELYPSIVCTANLHSIIHIYQCVKDWGPLWCYSTFGYENLNGFLLRQCHGTGNVLPQICRSLLIQQKLYQITNNAKNYTSDRLQMYTFKYDTTCSQPNSPEFMKVKYVHLDEDERRALLSINIVSSEIVATINRLKLPLQVLHIRNEKRKRNTSVCEVRYSENSDNFELIFISVRRLCTINKNWYAIGDVLEKTHESILDCEDNFPCAHRHIQNFIHKVKMSLTKRTIAVPVCNIIRVCVHIAIKYFPMDYIILQPNEYEHH